MKTPTYSPLVWETEYDENNNTVYVAESCMHDDGVAFSYRIYPKLVDDQIKWCDGSPIEVCTEVSGPFGTLEELKSLLEEEDRGLWDAAVAHGEVCDNPEND